MLFSTSPTNRGSKSSSSSSFDFLTTVFSWDRFDGFLPTTGSSGRGSTSTNSDVQSVESDITCCRDGSLEGIVRLFVRFGLYERDEYMIRAVGNTGEYK